MNKINSQSPKVWLNEVSFMRPILLVLLVSYHAFAPYVGTWPMPDGIHQIDAYSWLGYLSRAFRLEGFVFISGYIFTFQVVERKKFDNFQSLLISKVQRLLIPSFVFSAIYFFCFKEYVKNDNFVVSVLSGTGHLWYLPCLFYCFLIQYLLLSRNIRKSHSIIILTVMLLLSIVPLPLNLNKPLYYMTFFYWGGIFWEYSDYLKRMATSRNILISWMIFAVLFVSFNLIMIEVKDYMESIANPIYRAGLYEINNVLKAILGWSGIIALYLYAAKYCMGHSLGSAILKIGACGYGVYVFHQFILVYLYRYTGLPDMAGSYLLPWVGIFVTVLLSTALTLAVRSTKLGRKYL